MRSHTARSPLIAFEHICHLALIDIGHHSSMRSPLPTFSIVIPTYERPGQLETCLRSIAQLDYRRDKFEVVVVDDGSRSPPHEIVAGFLDRMRVELIVQPHGGPARARNAGAAAAQAEYLAFTDDDCAPARDWLRRLAEHVATAPGHAIGGRTINRLMRNPYSTATQMLIEYLYSYYFEREGRFFTSNNLAVPAALFREIGGFDSTWPIAAGEDREFCVRWSDRGYRLLEAPDAVVEHAHRLGLGGFCRQHFNYGRGAYFCRKLTAKRENNALRLEPFWFYMNLVRYPFVRQAGVRSLRLASLLAVSQVANVLGFAYQSAQPHDAPHNCAQPIGSSARENDITPTHLGADLQLLASCSSST